MSRLSIIGKKIKPYNWQKDKCKIKFLQNLRLPQGSLLEEAKLFCDEPLATIRIQSGKHWQTKNVFIPPLLLKDTIRKNKIYPGSRPNSYKLQFVCKLGEIIFQDQDPIKFIKQ